MADPPFAATYEPPAAPLPAWLSYLSAPAATALVPYTIATLDAAGVPTLVTGAVEVTQYKTVVLQLPITVDSAADVRGQDLGELYTTAGGDAQETIVRELGGSRSFTLGDPGATRALAGDPAAAGSSVVASATGSQAEPSLTPTATVTPAPSAGRSSLPASSEPAATSTGASLPQPSALNSGGFSQLPSASDTGSSPSSGAGTSPTSVVSSALASLSSVSPALSGELTDSASTSSSLLASASSVSSSPASPSASPSSSLSLSSSMPSSSSSSSSLTSSLLPTASTPASSTSLSPPSLASASSDDSSLTPSQLAAAIAAPICFFLLLVALLLLLCCCIRRRRRRRAERRISEEEGLLAAGGAAAGAAPATKMRSRGLTWDVVPQRMPSDGRTSRASGRSALSRLTGGLLGAGGATGPSRSSVAGSTPRSSPHEPKEGGFDGGEAEKLDEEQELLTGDDLATMGESDVGTSASPRAAVAGLAAGSTAGATVAALAASRSRSPQRSPRSPLRSIRDGGESRPERFMPLFADLPSSDEDPFSPGLSTGRFDEVDLTSPRIDQDGEAFGSTSSHDAGPSGPRPLSVPVLPETPHTDGALRLSHLYDPPLTIQLPPSPASYDPPSPRTPSGDMRRDVTSVPPISIVDNAGPRFGEVSAATVSLGHLWSGYETSSPQTDTGGSPAMGDGGASKRDTRLGYLSWSSVGEPPVPQGTATTGGQYGPEFTPPHTPQTLAEPGLRIITEDEDSDVGSGAKSNASSRRSRASVVSERGWLSGLWGPGRHEPVATEGEEEFEEMRTSLQPPLAARRGSADTGTSRRSELSESSLPPGELFLNDPRWNGTNRRRSSPPPFSSFVPSAVSYDPPVAFPGTWNSASLYQRPSAPPRSTSFTTDSASRYDDAPSPMQGVLALDSPFVYGAKRRSAVEPLQARTSQRRSAESGLSVLDRIAASFGSVKEGLVSGLGIDSDGNAGRRRSTERQREYSTESVADPFQHSVMTYLPTIPSPANTPPRRRSLLSLRRSNPSLHHAHSHQQLALPIVEELDSSAEKASSAASGMAGVGTGGGRGRAAFVDPFDDGV
ncbi:uncharacterized protein JCM10292_002533 [Rhodotorula paludigena]|uniref:uncharacterized protein n=1 Tax=Rhodotorula paludigena TaxID=86838 RepID=UPI00317FE02E